MPGIVATADQRQGGARRCRHTNEPLTTKEERFPSGYQQAYPSQQGRRKLAHAFHELPEAVTWTMRFAICMSEIRGWYSPVEVRRLAATVGACARVAADRVARFGI